MKTQIVFKSDYILVTYPEIVTTDELQQLVRHFEVEIDKNYKRYNRLHDLRATKSNLIKYEDLLPLAQRRRKSDPLSDTRNAYIVNDDLQFGMVRMWQTLMDSSGLKIAIFFSQGEAEAYVKPTP
jgi:hypothetical protein